MGSNREASSSPSVSQDDSSSRESSLPAVVTQENGQTVHTEVQPEPQDGVPLPAFLRQTRIEIQNSFTDLGWAQSERLHRGLASWPSPGSTQWARATGEDVIKRNRYANVEVFVNNRVKLNVPEGHSDYINASHIKLQNTKSDAEKYFIATQGPKEDTQSHMWRMIWHETGDPAVVVMLTQTHEAGREKCFQYFPADMENPTLNIDEQDEFGDNFMGSLTLRKMTQDTEARSTLREMELKTADGKTKTVYHYLFARWSDFGAPEHEDKDALLSLIKVSTKMNSSTGSPRVVHCSAGVGRSGTFIALDWLLTELEEGSLDEVPDDLDPIVTLVDELRQQRMYMVQAEPQFCFLYEVLKECWMARWRQRQGEKEDGGHKESVLISEGAVAPA